MKKSKPTILLGGLPGSGKTTLVRSLQKEHALKHISTDQIRRRMGSDGIHFEDQEEIAVYERMLEVIEEASSIDDGLVVIDTTSLPKERTGLQLVPEIEKISSDYGRLLHKIWLTASAKDLLWRNMSRSPDNDEYQETILQTLRIFSRNLPLGSYWEIIGTTGSGTEVIALEALKIICRERPSTSEDEKILAQIEFDLINQEAISRWSDEYDLRAFYNDVVTNKESVTSLFLKDIMGEVKADSPFLPEKGTLFSNATGFLIKIIEQNNAVVDIIDTTNLRNGNVEQSFIYRNSGKSFFGKVISTTNSSDEPIIKSFTIYQVTDEL